MSEIPPPDPGPVNPTPPPTSPAPQSFAQAQAAAPYLGPPPDQDSKTMGMLAHLLGIFTNWIGPLIIWLIKKDQSPFVNDQGKEALNWQLTVFIAYFVLSVVRAFMPALVGCVLTLLLLGAWIVNVIFVIQGAMAASKGVAYRYPIALRLIK